MDKQDGWTAPKSYREVWERFALKHGDSPETRKIHLKWVKLAREVGITGK